MKPAGSRPAGRRNTVQYLQTGGGCKVEMEEHPQDKGKGVKEVHRSSKN